MKWDERVALAAAAASLAEKRREKSTSACASGAWERNAPSREAEPLRPKASNKLKKCTPSIPRHQQLLVQYVQLLTCSARFSSRPTVGRSAVRTVQYVDACRVRHQKHKF